jgi:uncharacterized protein
MTRTPLTKPPVERLEPRRSLTGTHVALVAAIVALVGVLLYPTFFKKEPPRPSLLSVEAGVPQTGLRTVTMRLGDRDFQLEVADTPDRQRDGLMFRKTMPANHGMIFVFPVERPLTFWMRNTFIPLDVVFVNVQRQVVAIKPGRPLDERTSISSDAPASYAIELNRGAAAAAGLKVGDRIDIPADARPGGQ